MKAWSDLEEDPNVSLYWTGDYENPKSLWYIDHGIKIEKFPDGTIQLYNAMMSGDFYKPLTKDQIAVFEQSGWLRGCYNVCIDTYMTRLNKLMQLINLNPDAEELIGRKKYLEKKLARYFDLLDNLVI
jgi:hypothetical protein